jgi:F-type H+-transporting ATPase subunit b
MTFAKMTISKRLKMFAAMVAFALTMSTAGAMHARAAMAYAVKAPQAAPESEAQKIGEEEYDEAEQYKHSAMVKKIGKMMGMSTGTAATTFEVANFAVLALLVGYGLLKVLPKTFKDRTSSIQKQLVDARTATEQASIRLSGVEERLSHLDAQIAEMKAQAERDSVADEARIKASVEEETKKILAAADREIAAASMHAQRDLQRYAAELAIEQAAKKLVISAETDRLLVQNFARQLSGDDSKGGQN